MSPGTAHASLRPCRGHVVLSTRHPYGGNAEWRASGSNGRICLDEREAIVGANGADDTSGKRVHQPLRMGAEARGRGGDNTSSGLRDEFWSMDFLVDQLADGRRFRALTAVDFFTHECLALSASEALGGREIVAALKRLRLVRELPQRVDGYKLHRVRERAGRGARPKCVDRVPLDQSTSHGRRRRDGQIA